MRMERRPGVLSSEELERVDFERVWLEGPSCLLGMSVDELRPCSADCPATDLCDMDDFRECGLGRIGVDPEVLCAADEMPMALAVD